MARKLSPMSERSIFSAALDIADPAQRSAYLDQACGGDSAQRKHVEELIAVEAKMGGFLAQPHVEIECSDKVAALRAWQRAPAGRHEWRDRVPLHSDSGLPVFTKTARFAIGAGRSASLRL